jgi:hypothetical protein
MCAAEIHKFLSKAHCPTGGESDFGQIWDDLKTFCAFQPDPLAHTIDAFHLKWHGFLGYAFPPFCLLGKVMQTIIQDGAIIIVVAPYWPTKPWFTMFRKLMISEPLRFAIDESSLSLPHRNNQDEAGAGLRHPLTGRLSLMAALLSGNHYC